MEADRKTVMKLMGVKFPSAADFNVDGGIVDIMDDQDNVIGQISTDELTEYWNEAEELEASQLQDEIEYFKDVQAETGIPNPRI